MDLNTSTMPLRPSPALDAGLTPKQKARLHEVADLLLEIYQTLARMRRIKAAWIQPGPHDLTAHLPLYASLGLDPRVIYLYSIMPCLDPLAASTSSARFFQSCGFFDPRNEEHVREAREFHHDCAVSEDDPGCELRPWTTALSQTGQHAAIVMYDARRHVVFFLDNSSYDNLDRNLGNGEEWSVSEEEEEWGEENDEEDDGDEDEEEDDDEEEEDKEDEEQGEKEGEEEEEEESEDAEQERYFDYLDARAAGAVLRDILGWYRDLVDVPGCSADVEEWWGHDDALRAVYHKHGWPGENFDGDAFVVDPARVIPAAKIRFEPEEALPSRLEQLQHMVRESEEAEKAATLQGLEKLAAANDVGGEWVARWEIWNAKQLSRESEDRLMRAEELVAQGRGHQKVEDLPLWEWDQVRRDLEYAQLSLGWLKQGLEDTPSQETIRYGEEQVATLQKACTASQADAESLCPGRSISSLDRDESVTGLQKKMKLEYLAGELRYLEQCVVNTREWIAQLPEGAGDARGLAQNAVDEKIKELKQLRQEVNRA